MSTNISLEPEIFEVKQYDSQYRIMCMIENKIYFFECFGGVRVKKGKDLLEKLNLHSAQINSASYELENVTKTLKTLEKVRCLVEDLYVSECKNIDSIDVECSKKTLNLELKDHTITKVELYENGYVKVSLFEGLFYLNNDNLNELYLQVK